MCYVFKSRVSAYPSFENITHGWSGENANVNKPLARKKCSNIDGNDV